MKPLWLHCALVILTTGACVSDLEDRSQDINAPPGTRSAILQALLDPRATLQTLWVEWSIPADSSGGNGPRPIDPALVSLSIVGPDGIPVPLTPGAPGQFTAQLQVMPDSVYRLEGTVDAKPVSATVTVPDSLQVITPASDTVRPLRDGFRVAFPYEFIAAGATVFTLTDISGFTSRLSASRGVLEVFASEDTLRLTLAAYEPFGGDWSVDFFTDHPLASNLTGAYGYFGAFVQSRPIIVIPQ